MRGGQTWLRAGGAVLGSAAAYYLVRGAHPVWPLAWLPPAPVLAFGFEASFPAGAAAAFAAYTL